MKHWLIALLAALFGAGAAHAATAAKGTQASGQDIAWHAGDVDSAFARAKRERRPLFLYWGAEWCPPCNQVKATIFNRRDFIERSRVFVPVYIDGDSPSAQLLASRFKVSGYPTMVLFRPDGTEVTRLPGEVDPQQYMRVLTLGMHATRPVKALLAAALSDNPVLTPADWRLLAYYSWETDHEAAVPKAQVAATLARLAQQCPHAVADARARLTLKAIAAAAGAKDKPAAPAAYPQVKSVLADAKLARENFSALTDAAGEIAGYVTAPGSADRRALVAEWDRLLARFGDDASLSKADRVSAAVARVALARLDLPKDAPLPGRLVAEVRAAAERADRETTDRYERQAVISAAAYALREAGLLDESDAILKRELVRSHSPYYFMSGLAGNAKKRGDKAAALGWYEQAYAASKGPATRLQWGASYVNALIELTPEDAARIEAAARSVIGEIDPVPATFHERNRAVLERMGGRIVGWAETSRQDVVLAALRRRLGEHCAKLPAHTPERETCDGVLRAKAGSGH
ncbi:MAG: thioredoxin family protein [Pseudomonadota bacterium]|jgi:thioredoxin-related protein